MSLKEGINFVKRVVPKKSHDLLYTHVQLTDGWIIGSNGQITIGHPTDIDIDICPLAEPFFKAITHCDDEDFSFKVTPAQKLSIKSKKYKAFIPSLDSASTTGPVEQPDKSLAWNIGDTDLITGLKVLLKSLPKNANKPWANGILFDDKSGYATNTKLLMQYWIGCKLCADPFILPVNAVEELAKIGENPTHVHVTSNQAVFHYKNGGWLRTSLIAAAWPDFKGLFGIKSTGRAFTDIAGLAEALKVVKPMVNDRGNVVLSVGKVSTSSDLESGASYQLDTLDRVALTELEGVSFCAVYNIHDLLTICETAVSIDLSQYPNPTPWTGGVTRGVISPIISSEFVDDIPF